MANLRQLVAGSGQESGRASSPRSLDPDDQLDPEGIPTSAPVADWLDLFDPSSPVDPRSSPVDPRSSRWLQAVLRFGRPDGSPVFGPKGRSTARLRALEAWAARLGDPSLAAVVARWIPGRTNGSSLASPPLPTYSDAGRPLAIFRSDWGSAADLVAIDHRRPGDETQLEVASKGRIWLGPSWTSGAGPKATPPVLTSRSSSPFADGLEWSSKVGPRRTTRCVALLRGRSMALLGQQDDGAGDWSEVHLELADGVEARPVEGSRALRLSGGRGRPVATLMPLGLPAHDRPTDQGSIAVDGRRVVVRQGGEGRRRWLPVLLCWGKAPTTWLPLTVADRSKVCQGDVASAVRVAWGPRDEGLVVYRSLATPALRSFLGHQAGSRLLVGSFTRSGELRPILKVGP